MKSVLLRRRRGLTSKPHRGLPKREQLRRLAGLGLSKHEDEAVQTEALAIIARFLAFTRESRCIVSGCRTGERLMYGGQDWIVVVEAAHLQSRGAYASDLGTVLPLVDLFHREQHRDPTFWTRRHLDVAVLARLHAIRFFEAHPEDAQWVLDHANDGDVIVLAHAGLAER